jgi:hypothetical protein
MLSTSAERYLYFEMFVAAGKVVRKIRIFFSFSRVKFVELLMLKELSRDFDALLLGRFISTYIR